MLIRFFAYFVAISLLILSRALVASPWVGTIDKQLHYDLQTLVEWGYLDATANTYPIPWRGISAQLEALSTEGLPYRPTQALLRLQHYLSLQKQAKTRQYLSFQAASEIPRFRSLDDGVDNTAKASITTELYAGAWSAQVNVNYAKGGERNLDNSFIAYQLGDWNFRLGSIDQFWGPAQSSSLILSNNARPIKSLAFSRSTTAASTHPWLSWLGPWYLSSQFGQLEKNRAVPKAKILLNRFTARPIKGLELGASWALMWGGEGQDESLDSFIEAVTFQSVCIRESGICTDAQLTKRGNHLAGFDLSYTTHLFARPVSFYIQRIGEDSVDTYRITDNANLFGISSYLYGVKLFVETSDTQVNCDGNVTTNLNCYYENGTYQSGYRAYSRAIGSTFDSDAKQITFGANFRFDNGAVAELLLRDVQLNNDGTRPSPVLTDSNKEALVELSGFYQQPFGKWLVKAGASLAKRDLPEDSQTDSLIYIKAQYAY
ncbi:capsule assembly Wzi family protein [Agaribacter flavus]|uniref:Capsule assembly Wzi family protein n=1 Tax=Agaribacter flavus TaxID=1902781 RepID=A0ABV7FUS0_9ALTE